MEQHDRRARLIYISKNSAAHIHSQLTERILDDDIYSGIGFIAVDRICIVIRSIATGVTRRWTLKLTSSDTREKQREEVMETEGKRTLWKRLPRSIRRRNIQC